jgi:hypothetical protein
MKSSGIQMCNYKAKHGPRKWTQSPLLVLGHKKSQAATKAKVDQMCLELTEYCKEHGHCNPARGALDDLFPSGLKRKVKQTSTS